MMVHGIVVKDIPKCFAPNSSHSIIIKEENVKIPLSSKGVISYVHVQTPTVNEIETCQQITLTSDIEWNPNSLMDTTSKISMISTSESEEKHDSMTRKINEIHITSSATVNKKKLFIEESELASRWSIGIKDAHETVNATTQKFILNALHPIERRFQTKNAMLRYNNLNCQFSSDTFFSNVKSLLQNTCAQLFVTDFGYLKFSPMKQKSEAGFALKELIQDVGIPKHLHTDGAKELTLGTWKQICKETGIQTTQTEAHSPWQSRTDVEIRELKRHVRRLTSRSQTPTVLWDFCCQYVAELRNRIACLLLQLHGHTPYKMITGNTPDISKFLEFTWYQPVWYYAADVFPQENKLLGRWIGIAHRVGQAMCFQVLPSSGMAYQ